MKHTTTFLLSIISLICFIGCSSPKQQKEDKQQEEAGGKLPSLIEIVTDIRSDIPVAGLKKICKEYDIDTTSIYRWRNHLIVYNVLEKPQEMISKLGSEYPGASIKYYDIPFYVFNRENCEDKETVADWSHTIMTANLVNDTILQKEYMDYHATQADKWPEVAAGFCKADFQQLLIFRNGRQLMLIISIPEGKNLDDLNPKTTENNPRVDEWNILMSKYQEGIEGNEQGSAWVVLEKASPNPSKGGD